MSLPDDLVDKIKRAAGGEGQVSAYVATALADYQEQASLDELPAAWRLSHPYPTTCSIRSRPSWTVSG